MQKIMSFINLLQTTATVADPAIDITRAVVHIIANRFHCIFTRRVFKSRHRHDVECRHFSGAQ